MGFDFNPQNSNDNYEGIDDTNNYGQKFIRSKQDNELLKCIQIKDNFFDIVDKDAVVICDADGIPFKTSSSVEEDYVVVKCLLDEKEVFEDLKVTTEEYSNISAFKGRTRGDKIAVGSPLSDLNIKREISGLTPYKMSDFEITPKKRLKYEKGTKIDGIKFENSLEVCKYFIDKWFEAILKQTQLKKIRPVLGGGKTSRHAVLVPHQYKSTRSDGERPILLSEARQYVKDKYDTILAPPLVEADEVVDAMAAIAYDKAKLTGTKIKAIKSSFDKDAFGKRGVLFNWDKDFHFKYPQCWLIESEDIDVGHLELVKGKIKGSSLLFTIYQILMADSADEYSPRRYLPEDFKHFGHGYGDESFYRDFAPIKTPHDALQKLIDKYYEWFPHGLVYTAWDGTEVDEDTLSYLEKHFYLAYMREGKNDKTVIRDWLDKYEVDYSKLIDNNKLTSPERVFIGNEEHILALQETLNTILKDDMKGFKTLKSKEKDEVFDIVKEKLSSINFECHYEMQQKVKIL